MKKMNIFFFERKNGKMSKKGENYEERSNIDEKRQNESKKVTN
jgi:hypothetical protein